MRNAKAIRGRRIRGSSTSSKARASPPRARGPGPLVVGLCAEAELAHEPADTVPSFIPRSVYFPHWLPAQQAANLVGEAVRVKRFAEKAIETGGARLLDLLLAGLGRDGRDDGISQPARRPDLGQGGIAILIRQTNVHQDQVDLGQGVGKFHHLPAGSLPF